MTTRKDQAMERSARLFLKKQTEMGTFAEHGPDDAVRHAGVTLSAPRERSVTEDADRGIAARSVMVHGKESSVSIGAVPIRPSGTSGTAGEHDSILEGLLGRVDTPADKAVVSGAASEITLDSVTDVRVGHIAFFARDGEVYDAAIVAAIDDTNPIITLSPALQDAPETSDDVIFGRQHQAVDGDVDLYTVVRDGEHFQEIVADQTINEGTISVNQQDRITIEASLLGSGLRAKGGTTELAAELETEATEMEVATGALIQNVDSDLYYEISSAETHEVVKVTGKEGSTRAITRGQKGSSATTHPENSQVAPWRSEATRLGSPLLGLKGRAVVAAGDDEEVVQLRDTQFGVNNGYVYDADALKDHRNVRARQGSTPREINVSGTVRLTRAMALLMAAGEMATEMSFLWWVGDTPGAMVGAGCLKAVIEIPQPSDGLGDKVTLPFSGRALEATVDGANELCVALP